MKIVTLTLSAAFDIHCEAESLCVNSENIASVIGFDAGGKGVNISKALCKWGTENLAIVVLGSENRADFVSSLARDGISYREISTSGRISRFIRLTEKKPGFPLMVLKLRRIFVSRL